MKTGRKSYKSRIFKANNIYIYKVQFIEFSGAASSPGALLRQLKGYRLGTNAGFKVWNSFLNALSAGNFSHGTTVSKAVIITFSYFNYP